MSLIKNLKFSLGIGLVLLGGALIGAWFLRAPTREISRAEMDQLLKARALQSVRITPTPFPGIYAIQARHPLGRKAEKVVLTTHFDEEQVKRLLDLNGGKIDLPDQELRGQWISLVSTIVIGGLVILVSSYQYNLGRGKNTKVRQRP